MTAGATRLMSVAVLAVLSTAATAEPADPAPAPAQPEAGPQLEEIVVYARRRDERVEDVPLAVTVQTGVDLENKSAQIFSDVGRDVPNVYMFASPQSVNALDVTIRGQTVNRSAIVFDPAVGLYVDGVYNASGQGSMSTLLDIDHVEIVRGSQGTLFGRNNTGGSISFFTNRPVLTTYSADLTAGVGSYNELMGRAIVNAPISDEFGLRFAIQANQRDGWGQSVGSGQDNFANQQRYQLRFGALWKPSDATDAYFTYERFSAAEVGAILHPLTGPAPGTFVSQMGQIFSQFQPLIPGLPTVVFPRNKYNTDGNYHASDGATNDAVHLTVDQRLGQDVTAKLILGYRHVDATTGLDVDATTIPLADTKLHNTSNERSAEFQLAGKSLGGKLDWVGGLYWFLDNGGAPSVQIPASPQFIAALGTLAEMTGGQADFTPYFSPFPVYDISSARNESEAAFLHGEYEITDRWAMAAGVRYTYDDRQLNENAYVDLPVVGQMCTILDANGQPIYGPCPKIHKDVSYDYWSWEFSTRYRINDELNSYLRIGRSQRSGGWNTPLTTTADPPFGPEQLTDYEIGLKANALGGALQMNVAAFYGDYQDMQRLLAMLTPTGTPTTIVTNAGSATVSGVELEAAWRVAAGLSLLASFGWTDARYDTFEFSPVPGYPPIDLSKNDFYQTPRYQASGGVAYDIPTPVGTVRLYADYAWQDKLQFNVINDFNYQKAYGTLNARVTLEAPSKAWEVSLYGTNLTNTHYAYTGGTLTAPLAPYPTIAFQMPGEPLLVGLEGTYHWGRAR